MVRASDTSKFVEKGARICAISSSISSIGLDVSGDNEARRANEGSETPRLVHK